jgi:signal transduction histidine kinase
VRPTVRTPPNASGWVDLAQQILAGALGVAVAVELVAFRHWAFPDWAFRGSDVPAAAALVLAVLVAVPLMLLRARAELTVGFCLVVVAAWEVLPGTPSVIALLFTTWFALFVAGLRIRRSPVVFSVIAAAAAVLITVGDPSDVHPADFLFSLGLMAASVGLGVLLSSRLASAERAAERAHRAEDSAELLTRVTVQDERTRIARELHDVVAHAVSVIVVQSVAGRAAVHTKPEEAHAAFTTIRTTGQQALAELRRLLGVLRVVDETALMTPQPSLAELDDLVARMREGGLRPTVRVLGEPRLLPPGIELSAFRIVQEALTNALQHAGPVDVDVEVEYAPDALRCTVRSPTPAGGPGGPLEPAHGLVGMRERAALCGGHVAVERDDGMFTVSAELPLARVRAGAR